MTIRSRNVRSSFYHHIHNYLFDARQMILYPIRGIKFAVRYFLYQNIIGRKYRRVKTIDKRWERLFVTVNR